MDAALREIRTVPARRAVNPLFSFFHAGDPVLKWRAVEAMGRVVADLAETDLESARVVLRRLMWNLNDESGGIGWGSPEAMGEITARSGRLAGEFADILISYIREEGNFLEHPVLQRGSLWGVGRLARARPDLARNAAAPLAPFLESEDPALRGLAAWAAVPVADESIFPLLRRLVDDNEIIEVFEEGRFAPYRIGDLARRPLETGPEQGDGP